MATSPRVGRSIQEPWISAEHRSHFVARCRKVGVQNGDLVAALARNNVSSMSLAAVPAVFSAFIPTVLTCVIATWSRLHPVKEFYENKNG